MSKANIKLEFENCSIPSALETVALLPNWLAEQITSYNYCSTTDWSNEVGFSVMNSPSREHFIKALETERLRVFHLIRDDKIDPESHDIDYVFSTAFEDWL